MRLVGPLPLSVSPITQRTVSPAATGSGADQLFAGLKRDVCDFARRGIDLIESAVREGIDLNGIDIVGADRLNAGGIVGGLDDERADARLW